jgi:hypothetical protein
LGAPGPSAEDISVNVASVTDADVGNALQVTAVGPSFVTLAGPGNVSELLSVLMGSFVTITAWDGVIGVPVIMDCDATVEAQITYNFVGFGSPLGGTNDTRLVKRGSTVPVKFRLYDAMGTEICVPLGGGHMIGVIFSQGASPPGDPDIDDSGSSNENGVFFRYSGTCGVDGMWIYNLQTNSSYYVNSTYRIEALLDDGTVHETYISTKK